MPKTKIVELSEPIKDHRGMIKRLVLREPKGDSVRAKTVQETQTDHKAITYDPRAGGFFLSNSPMSSIKYF
jgi:hypothetical protein